MLTEFNKMNKENIIKRLLIWNCFPGELIPVEADLPGNWQITTDHALFQSVIRLRFLPPAD